MSANEVVFLFKFILFFTAGSAFMAAMWGKRAEWTILFWPLTAVIFSFICGCVNLYSWAWPVVAGGTILLWLATAAAVAGNFHGAFKKFWANFCTPGVLIYIIGVVALWFVLRYYSLAMYSDEMTHWGEAVRELYLEKSFPAFMNYTCQTFTNYPPGTAILNNFGMMLYGSYREGVAFFCQNALCMGMVLSVLGKSKWRDLPVAALLYFGVLVMTNQTFEYLRTIYVDSILNLSFGWALLFAVWNYKERVFCALGLSLALPWLILIKKSGSGLAVMVIVFVIAVLLCELFKTRFKRSELRKYIQQNWVYALPAVCFMAVRLCWNGYQALINNPALTFTGKNISLTAITNAIVNNQPGNAWPVAEKMFELTCFNFGVNCTLWQSGYCGVVLVAAVILFAAGRLVPDRHLGRRISGSGWLVLVGFLVYAFTLYIYYVFEFNVGAADQLPSGTRYIGSFINAVWLILVGGISNLCFQYRFRLWQLAVLLLVIPGMSHWQDYYGFVQRGERHNNHNRSEFFVAEQINAPLYNVEMAGFGVLDVKDTDIYMWKTYNKYQGLLRCNPRTGEILTKLTAVNAAMKPEKWGDALAGQDYLYVNNLSKEQEPLYLPYFADLPRENRLYQKVNGKFKLLPLEKLEFDFANFSPYIQVDNKRIDFKFSAEHYLSDRALKLYAYGKGSCKIMINPKQLRLTDEPVKNISLTIFAENSSFDFIVRTAEKQLWTKKCDWNGWKTFEIDAENTPFKDLYFEVENTDKENTEIYLDSVKYYFSR